MVSFCLANIIKTYGTNMNKTELSDQLKNLFESCQVDFNNQDWTPKSYSSEKLEKIKMPLATFRDDPVALACAAYRRWLEVPADRWASFETLKVTEEDRVTAMSLRKYYQQRYTMQALKGQTLTEFQVKAATFLNGDRSLHTDELGLLYRLPYFYAEDLAIDQVVYSTDDDQSEYLNRPLINEKRTATITPLLQSLKSRKSGDVHQFWFRAEPGYALVQEVPQANTLLPFFKSVFKQPKLQVNAYVRTNKFFSHDRYYGRLINLELV